MRYFGGKVKIGKEIAGLINQLNPPSYHEPFCGMFGVGRHVISPVRTGADIQDDLILLLNAVRDGWVGPDTVSLEEWNLLKEAEPSPLRGFAGFGCSHSGIFFRSYATDKTGRNYAGNAKRSLIRLAPLIQGVDFCVQDYKQYEGGAKLIYCDPPYWGTSEFQNFQGAHKVFWDWVRRKSEDALVLVSEYTAPKDAHVVWEKEVKLDMKTKVETRRVEKLFSFHKI